MSSRPRSNELARSGYVPMAEKGQRAKVDEPMPVDAGGQGLGPVPPANRPGYRPERDPDKPEGPPDLAAATADPEEGQAMTGPRGRATVAERLRTAQGLTDDERADVVDRFASLDTRLASFSADEVDLELSVKERDGRGQRVTLECWVAGRSRLVATSTEGDLAAALNEVRDDLRRQLDDAITRTEPKNSRQLRARPPVEP